MNRHAQKECPSAPVQRSSSQRNAGDALKYADRGPVIDESVRDARENEITHPYRNTAPDQRRENIPRISPAFIDG